MGLKLFLGTANPGKQKDLQEIFGNLGLEILCPDDLEDVEETGTTFQENARLKAKAYAKISGEITLADDSGLCIPDLPTWDPIKTGRWFYSFPTPQEAFSALERELEGRSSKAYFVSHLTIANPAGDILVEAVGELHGHLSFPPRGDKGFGYCPVFVPEGKTETLAEIESDVRAKTNHRAYALTGLQKDPAFQALLNS